MDSDHGADDRSCATKTKMKMAPKEVENGRPFGEGENWSQVKFGLDRSQIIFNRKVVFFFAEQQTIKPN